MKRSFEMTIKPAQCILLACFWQVLLAPCAGAQSTTKSQEDWLRYSNWEHRSQSPHQALPKKEESSASSGGSEQGSTSEQAKLPVPDNPGNQTVDGVQPSVPGWAFQQPQQAQRSPQIILGGDTLGRRPGFANQGGFFGGYGASTFGNRWPAYGSSNGWLGGGGGWFPQSRLGPEVIETGPSPASGNYFSPSTGDPSASGNYYAGSAPWQVPLTVPNQQKSYWGPDGNPFAK